MNRRIIVAALVMLAVLAASHSLQAGVRKRIAFKPGATSGTVSGGVIRGDRDFWLVGAAKGQKMTVKIKSLENNAVFQIYAPNGKALPGADAGDDTMKWSGVLPAKGDYTIEVGGTRGNCAYTLTVSIKD